MKYFVPVGVRALFLVAILIGLVMAPQSTATVSGISEPIWGPGSSVPQVVVETNDYTAPSDVAHQCHDQDFVLRTANDENYYHVFKDTTYTECAFYADFGLASAGNFLYLNGMPQPYHLIAPPVTSFIPTPHAHSLFVQDAQFIEAYDHPRDAFKLEAGLDDVASHHIFEHEYHLKVGVTPRLLSDSKGHAIQYVKHTKISQNGDWLILEKGTQLYRVRANDFNDLLAFPGDPLFFGQDPNDDMTISNDGRYIALISNNHLNFKMYDLSTCVPNQTYNLTNATGCQPIDMVPLLSQKLGETINHVDEPQFSSDEKRLSIRVSVGVGADKHTELVDLLADGASAEAQPIASNYIALGDSYASGEGAFNYYSGTDEADNKCHLSSQSYPYLLGLRLQLDSSHSVACSGAKMINVNGYGAAASQHTLRPLDAFSSYWLPGYVPQLQYIQQQQPNIVTISMGGNDVGFSSIIKHCVVLGSCYSSYEERMGLALNINSKFNSLVAMYSEIKAADPDARVYVIGYPDIVTPDGDCGLNVHMNKSETEFASGLENYLNNVIELAAAKAGVGYVDTADTFAGFRLCDGSDTKAVNGLTMGNDSLGIIGQESYHPTALGHEMLTQTIQDSTKDFSNPNPLPAWGIATPDTSDASGFTGVPSTGQPIRQIEFDDEGSTLQSSDQVDGYLAVSQYNLSPQTSYGVWIHSAQLQLGTATTDSDGNLSYSVTIPHNFEPGWHTIDVYGTDISGQPVDIQRLIYVPASANDWDGDSVLNNQEPCGVFDPSGFDVDGDGIDDACDGVIGPPKTQNNDAPGISGQAGSPDLPIGQPKETPSAIQPASNVAFITSNASLGATGFSPLQPSSVLGAKFVNPAIRRPHAATATHESSTSNHQWELIMVIPLILATGIAWVLLRRRA